MNEERPEHILFLTGKLAEKRLHRVLESMQPTEFSYEVRNPGISVAALMTAQMLVRRLSDLDRVDRIIVPGLCLGDLSMASDQLGIPVIRGTVDIKDLPAFFGRDCQPPDLSHYDVKIFAEIVDAPMISIPEILTRAERYKRDGANVIDIGCLPDTPFPHMEEAIQALHDEGYTVSIDSLEAEDLLRGGKAGADYLLSLKESTLSIAEEVEAIPVLIPEQHGDMDSLYRVIEAFSSRSRSFIADSILDPIHFGFADSIIRYHELRQQYPDIEIMMGIGNLTELTEADTTGINAVLFGLISELHITNVLATEVSPHARSAVREADKARRMMYAARKDTSLPKGLGGSLLTTHELEPFSYDLNEISELAASIRDPSYRIQVSDEGIHIYNRDGMIFGQDPFALFARLEPLQNDAPHAFYIGVELARAQIAWQLGKRYNQDEALTWGAAIPETERETNASEFKEAGETLKIRRKTKQKKKKVL